jgi:hypothetical protein
LWLAAKHRSLTLFTAANPGIFASGLVGESKSQILRHLSQAAEFIVLENTLPVTEKVAAAEKFLGGRLQAAAGLETGSTSEGPIEIGPQAQACPPGYPIVLKPDVGERGTNVAIIRDATALRAYLKRAIGDVIVQRYVPGLEFGVSYCRYPNEARGCITSITEKHFPHVTGDGRSTIGELIQRDPRAALIADAYAKSCRRPMPDVPQAGERVALVEIGSHCRGSIFLDGSHLKTGALESAIDAAAKEHPGFCLGRFDLRAASIEDFQAGRFAILELNGVAGEATHVYDPKVTLLEAYRVIFRQWRAAFEIGALNRKQGAEPLSLRALYNLVLEGRTQDRDLSPVHHQDGGRTEKDRDGKAEELPAIAHRR